MTKTIKVLFVIVVLILLNSCALVGGRMRFGDEGKKGDARLEQLLEIIKKEDKDGLKALFSKKALKDADNLEGGIDYLFDIFHGSLKTWERTGLSSDGLIDYGKKSIMLRTFYKVTTDEEAYMFFVLDYTTDTIDPDNEGLYAIRVIKAEDRNTQFTYWQDMMIAGIYKPE